MYIDETVIASLLVVGAIILIAVGLAYFVSQETKKAKRDQH